MSKTYKDSPKSKAGRTARERNISVRAVRRNPPDLRKLSRALIALAIAEAAAEAAAHAGDTAQAAVSATMPPEPDGVEVSDD